MKQEILHIANLRPVRTPVGKINVGNGMEEFIDVIVIVHADVKLIVAFYFVNGIGVIVIKAEVGAQFLCSAGHSE